MIHFNAELWNIHQLFVFQVLIGKDIILVRKARKIGHGRIICRDIVLECRDRIPNRIRNSYVTTRIKLNSSKK